MALQRQRKNLKISFIFKAILFCVLAGTIIRLSIWESNYYKSEEGKERITPRVSGDISTDSTDLDETIISSEQITNYTVAADKPRFLSIERISIKNARILPVQETADGAIQVPRNIFDVGWYTGSSLPGQSGTSILDGHNGGPTMQGVFKSLNLLTKDDLIDIEMGDGTIYHYQVHDNITVSLSEANQKMKTLQTSPINGIESISLITCTGEWSDLQKTYLSRQFLRATRV